MFIAPGMYSVELGLMSRIIPELLAFAIGTSTDANLGLLAPMRPNSPLVDAPSPTALFAVKTGSSVAV